MLKQRGFEDSKNQFHIEIFTGLNPLLKLNGGLHLVQLSWFHGIKVSMFYTDHLPPYFHANYGDYGAIVDIQKAKIINGKLPKKQASLIIAWTYLHQDELMDNWQRAYHNKEMFKIDPLA